jgi:hypothetical protein
MDCLVTSDLLSNAAELLTCLFTIVAALVSYLFTWRA